jgi:gas vesicle protein GvpN
MRRGWCGGRAFSALLGVRREGLAGGGVITCRRAEQGENVAERREMTEDMLMTVLEPQPQPGFVETDYVRNIMLRAHSYLEAGFPVHFRGGSGTGKTTLAMHLAHLVARPVVLLHGDEEFSTSHLVGGEHGYRLRKVVDNFIHSVLKTEEDFSRRWVDSRLTLVCKYGFTLVYDEFTRSRPEANNVLLSILQEGILDLPAARGSESYLRVNPQFRAIFTSNPEEYAGTHKFQDALRDRMVTIDLSHFDRETETAITQAKSGIARQDAETIVELVRAFRKRGRRELAPTVRASIMIARIVQVRQAAVDAGDPAFRETCLDVLRSETRHGGSGGDGNERKALIQDLIEKLCIRSAPGGQPSARKRAQPQALERSWSS